MRLREFMRTDVETIESSEDATLAWTRMRQRRIRHLVVTERGEVAGVVSERDLGGKDGEKVRKGRTVKELMTGRVVTATPQMTLRQAANLMRGRTIGCLPVEDRDGRLVGIVTATDVRDELGRGHARPAVGERRRIQRAAPPIRAKSRSKPVVRQGRRGEQRQQKGRARPREPDGVARSPFPAELPRAAKRGAGRAPSPAVPAFVRVVGADLKDQDRAYIRRKLGMKLGKFAPAVERVSVRVHDVNGPRGGVDKNCRIKVVLSGLPSVVYQSRNASLNAAIDGALSGIGRSVRRSLQRRRMKLLKYAA
jgi:CBS domain-containing protein